MAPIEIDPATGAPIVVKSETSTTPIQPTANDSFAVAPESPATITEETKIPEAEVIKTSEAVPETFEVKSAQEMAATHLGKQTKLQQIEVVLRDGGMDSMQQIKSLARIKEILES